MYYVYSCYLPNFKIKPAISLSDLRGRRRVPGGCFGDFCSIDSETKTRDLLTTDNEEKNVSTSHKNF